MLRHGVFFFADDKAHFRALYATATQIFTNQIADARAEANDDPEMLAALDKFAAASDTWHRETGDPEIQLGSDPRLRRRRSLSPKPRRVAPR